jgi:uncharacterized membrane protein
LELSIYAAAFVASFVFIGLKSVQQLNVVYEKYWWILPTSVCMGILEVFIVVQAAKRGYDWGLVLSVGTGGGLGSTAATWLHSYIRKRK